MSETNVTPDLSAEECAYWQGIKAKIDDIWSSHLVGAEKDRVNDPRFAKGWIDNLLSGTISKKQLLSAKALWDLTDGELGDVYPDVPDKERRTLALVSATAYATGYPTQLFTMELWLRDPLSGEDVEVPLSLIGKRRQKPTPYFHPDTGKEVIDFDEKVLLEFRVNDKSF
jgi:hypothetical protein